MMPLFMTFPGTMSSLPSSAMISRLHNRSLHWTALLLGFALSTASLSEKQTTSRKTNPRHNCFEQMASCFLASGLESSSGLTQKREHLGLERRSPSNSYERWMCSSKVVQLISLISHRRSHSSRKEGSSPLVTSARDYFEEMGQAEVQWKVDQILNEIDRFSSFEINRKVISTLVLLFFKKM